VRSKEPRIEHTPCLARASLGNARRAAAVFHVRQHQWGQCARQPPRPAQSFLPAQSWDSGTAQPPRPRQGFLLMQQFESAAAGVAGTGGGEGGALADGSSAAFGRAGAVTPEGAPGKLPEARLAVLSQRLVHNARAASCATRRERRGWSRGPFRLTNWRPFPRQRGGFAERKTSLNGLVRSYGPIKIGLQNSHLGQQMQRSRQNDCQCQARDGGVGGFILIHLWVPLTVELDTVALGKLGYSRGAIE